MTNTLDLILKDMSTDLSGKFEPIFSTQDPFYGSVFNLGSSEAWVGYVFGSLFFALGIACFFFIPKTKRNVQRYKDEQLENYNKQYNKKETQYSRTGMYLPLGEKMKAQLPAILGVMFVLVGITWLVGHSITTL